MSATRRVMCVIDLELQDPRFPCTKCLKCNSMRLQWTVGPTVVINILYAPNNFECSNHQINSYKKLICDRGISMLAFYHYGI